MNGMIDRITDAFFAVNSLWEFTYINKEAARVLFREQVELVGKCMWNEFPEAVHLPFYEQYHKAMREQEKVEFEAYYPPLASWFEVRAYPSPDGLTVIFQDITRKKGARLQQELHYESLFKYNPEAVFSFDLDGYYLSVNPAMEQLLGYRESEYLNMSFIPLIQPEELELTIKRFTQAVKGITQHYETKAIHKNGKVIDVKVTNMPIIMNGETVGVYGVARNITKENKNEQLLLESEKLTAVGQLAASIAHEIRNPLTSLKGFIQLIEKNVRGVNPEYFNIMTDELTRIEIITNELLFLAKPQAQEFKSEQVGKIIHDVVMLLSSQALINRIEIKAVDVDDLPAVACVAAQLKQVFINLIKNAMEAMPDGGEIRIAAARPNPDTILVQVMDQGKGIPEEAIAKIGSPFYTTKENGTGLGMMATMKIIESHGGTVRISSREGKGTTISIHLPIAG
ncbi:ATP-binding protein [Paenibacillus sp. GCM10023248]|nr:PAS domain S-box protein [Paenibacillus sp. MAHUQ-63]